MSFAELGLSAPILEAVAEKGYDTPSPIQLQAIPAVIEGKDVMAAALFYHQQAGPRQRRENRRTGADHHQCRTGACLLPGFEALAVTERFGGPKVARARAEAWLVEPPAGAAIVVVIASRIRLFGQPEEAVFFIPRPEGGA